MCLTGQQNYKASDRYKDKRHFIGDFKNPLWVGTKGEVQSLFTEDFYTMYEYWRYFRSGFGLPLSGPWTEQNPIVMDCLLSMQEYYEYLMHKKPNS